MQLWKKNDIADCNLSDKQVTIYSDTDTFSYNVVSIWSWDLVYLGNKM